MIQRVLKELETVPARWLVTGAAGFIGSNLVEKLLQTGQYVTGMDNLSTGHLANLESVRDSVGEEAWTRFRFVEADITDVEACHECCKDVRYVLHQAALGSVPLSIDDPVAANAVNVGGFVNMLEAARKAGVKRFVYASSSAVYGDDPELPKREDRIGRQLSPYAVTKLANELYSGVFGTCYGMESIGLRYFNIFGPRQDPEGAYAAVIPKWFAALLAGDPVRINGDGETSRDFCYVENVVWANIMAAMSKHPEAPGRYYNIACGKRITLNELYGLLRDLVTRYDPEVAKANPVYGAERQGDIRHSLADVSLAKELLGFEAGISMKEGLEKAAGWYFSQAASTPEMETGPARSEDQEGSPVAA